MDRSEQERIGATDDCETHIRVMRTLTAYDGLLEENERLKADYYDLIYAVESKHDGESRHQTAHRYIREREERTGGPSQANKADMPSGSK